MRYTEVRRAKIAHALTEDIDKDTVELQDNYDGFRARAGRFPGALSQFAGQRLERHRCRHGHQYSAPQSGRSDRCLPRLYRGPFDQPRRTDGNRSGAGFSDRRHDHRQAGSARSARPRPRFGPHAGQVPHRGTAQGPRGDHRHRDSLSGEQGDDDRAHRRTGARQARRRHFRSARRKRPPRHARGHRAQARRLVRRRPQPALPLLPAADELRRQYAGAERRPAAGDEPEGYDRRLRRVPRRGDYATHALRTRQGARSRSYPGGLGGRRRQYRRSDRAHSCRARRQRRRATN